MNNILVGVDHNHKQCFLLNSMGNRHGLIAGATGTGKTITLQVLAEQFSRAGVPVFTADVKGDLSGLVKAGKPHEKIQQRVDKIGIEDFQPESNPCVFWDLYGVNGLPIRTTVEDIGSLLLAQIMQLNDVQEDVLTMAYKYAEDKELPLIDLKDLKAILQEMSENNKQLSLDYGNLNKTTLASITRKVIQLEDLGGEHFFAEPAFQIQHLLQKDFSGRGLIHILDAQKLMLDKRLYASFLLWLLSELFEQLEEVGNPEKPRLVFFFDEAHLLFKDSPKALIEKIEMVVRLIRSKGVGVFFVTQNPTDVPSEILSQLGNRIQHSLRAFSEKDKKAVQIAAQTFASNPEIDTYSAITQLGTGESLVSLLDEKATPQPVVQVLNSPPRSQMGPINKEERASSIQSSPFYQTYAKTIDKESAYEIIKQKRQNKLATESEISPLKTKKPPSPSSRRQSASEAFFKSLLRSIASSIGRILIQSLKRSLFKR